MSPVPAVLAVVIHEKRVLLVRRKNPPEAGLWGFPGGKVDPGETLAAAAARELAEETGVSGAPGAKLAEIDVRAEGFHYTLNAVACAYVGGVPVAADDVSEAEWVALEEVVSRRRPMSEGVAELARLAHDAI